MATLLKDSATKTPATTLVTSTVTAITTITNTTSTTTTHTTTSTGSTLTNCSQIVIHGGHRTKVATATTSGVSSTGTTTGTVHHSSAFNKSSRIPSSSTTTSASNTNFEYDDNEWDIGIGDLIIDLDADIEKTTETGAGTAAGSGRSNSLSSSVNNNILVNNNMSSNSNTNQQISNKASNTTNSNNSSSVNSKLAIEHSSTMSVDKGLKMKIKRTKTGTKASEAKHEIVKSSESQSQNGSLDNGKNHLTNSNNSISTNNASSLNTTNTGASSNNSLSVNKSNRNSTNIHRKDKSNLSILTTAITTATTSSSSSSSSSSTITTVSLTPSSLTSSSSSLTSATTSNSSNNINLTNKHNFVHNNSVNLSSISANNNNNNNSGNSTDKIINSSTLSNNCVNNNNNNNNSSSVNSSSANNNNGSSSILNTSNLVKSSDVINQQQKQLQIKNNLDNCLKLSTNFDNSNCVPPSSKKIKLQQKEMTDVSVGTSVGTITEPDCLGPCEPGTSVMLEGIVWHETEGGVLVVNVTWRGKTYVGTLLDCTRHDWAPPRFCDSPTSDLDARTPKGRGKRGRTNNNLSTPTSSSNDLINFTETRSSVHSKLRNSSTKGRRNIVSPTTFLTPNQKESSLNSSNSSNSNNSNKRKNTSRNGDDDISNNIRTTSPPSQNINNTLNTSTNNTTSLTSNNSNQSQNSVVSPFNNSKKIKTMSEYPSSITPISNSPPPSPVLLECPEPNCSKKYKHINGLKYHQSHAHGGVTDDDDTKDALTSLSENDESNTEVPSPTTTTTTNLVNTSVISTTNSSTPPIVSVMTTSTSIKSPSSQEKKLECTDGTNPTVPNSPPAITDSVESAKNLTKTNTNICCPAETITNKSSSVTSFTDNTNNSNKYQNLKINSVANEALNLSDDKRDKNKVSAVQVVPTNLKRKNSNNNISGKTPSPNSSQIAEPQNLTQNLHLPLIQSQNPVLNTELDQHLQKNATRDEIQSPTYSDISDDNGPTTTTEADAEKIAKAAETTAKKLLDSGQGLQQHSLPFFPYFAPSQSPQYIMQTMQQQQQQPQQQQDQTKVNKDGIQNLEKDKDINKKDDMQNQQPQTPQQQQSSQSQQQQSQTQPQNQATKMLSSPHYYPYGCMPSGYYNLDGGFGPGSLAPVPLVTNQEEKMILKEEPKDLMMNDHNKASGNITIPNPTISIPTPGKIKSATLDLVMTKDKSSQQSQNDNNQVLKENIDIKTQMNSFMYQAAAVRQQHTHQQQQQQQQSHHQQQHQREEDLRRYYLYSDKRKEAQQHQHSHQSQPLPTSDGKKSHLSSSSSKHKEDKKEKIEIKQEGVKPTMETHGPPPPPTSQYAYIHPGYMQPSHYGPLPFDPTHPVYRSIFQNPYSNNPYLHQIPRFHAPEDLSRSHQNPNSNSTTKALDLLQHHANQYYTSHKIHELQERAMKSPPNSKSTHSSMSPSNNSVNNTNNSNSDGRVQQQQQQNTASNNAGNPINISNKEKDKDSQVSLTKSQNSGASLDGNGKDSSRSPPPQRHVHTHHHTHVGLGYPILAGQYPSPYSAAVLASQQAAAVTVINPFTPPK